jgi:hypothetical protein
VSVCVVWIRGSRLLPEGFSALSAELVAADVMRISVRELEWPTVA